MYSRQSTPRQQPWQIPKNYSGSAFSQLPSDNPEQEPDRERPTDPCASDPVHACTDRSESKKGLPFGPSHKSGGIGFEELLILGLVLLISQSDESEGNNDLAFLLLLLLFIQ